MEEKKNHWTKKKLEEAKKKINKEIYKRDRQASIHIKLDDLAIVINDSIIYDKLYEKCIKTIDKHMIFIYNHKRMKKESDVSTST